MAITISDYIDVRARLQELGFKYPLGFALLPSNFDSAQSAIEFKQVSEAATVKTLLRNAGIPHDDIVTGDRRPPYIQNNAFEWAAPTIFVSGAFLLENARANYLSVALGVIANYATDFFKGMTVTKQVSLEIVVERTRSGSCKRINYKGPVEGLADLADVVKEAVNE